MWIESHAELGDHPKLYEASDELGVETPMVLGMLHLLWYWVMQYAPDGDLTDYRSAVIARACRWNGDAQRLVDVLVSSGFLDRTEECLVVHDWMDYTGKALSRREKARERSAQWRDGASEGRIGSVRTPNAYGTHTVPKLNAQRMDTERAAYANRTSDLTVPNLTPPLSILSPPQETEDKPETQPNGIPPSAGESVPPSAGEEPLALNGNDNGPQTNAKLPDEQLVLFEKFWAKYPEARRRDKAQAFAEWARIMPDAETVRWMSDGLRADMASDQWQTPSKIPFPATWLRKRRWEDCPKPAAVSTGTTTRLPIRPDFVPRDMAELDAYARTLGMTWPAGDVLREMQRDEWQLVFCTLQDAETRMREARARQSEQPGDARAP